MVILSSCHLVRSQRGVHVELGAEHSDRASRAGGRIPGLYWAAAWALPRIRASATGACADVFAWLAGAVYRAGFTDRYARRPLPALGAYGAAYADHAGGTSVAADRHTAMDVPPAAAPAAGPTIRSLAD